MKQRAGAFYSENFKTLRDPESAVHSPPRDNNRCQMARELFDCVKQSKTCARFEGTFPTNAVKSQEQ